MEIFTARQILDEDLDRLHRIETLSDEDWETAHLQRMQDIGTRMSALVAMNERQQKTTRIRNAGEGTDKEINKRFLQQYFGVEFKCIHCGYESEGDEPEVYFHHRDPDTKEFNVGTVISIWVPSKDNLYKMMEEIKKCDTLCSSCHPKEHAKMKRMAERKEYMKKFMRKIRS